ncbi:MAG: hypothetical protein ACLP5V_09860 [Candidatus Bathyarchaeia archaeon]
MPFFIPLLAAGLIGATVGAGAGVAVGYYWGRGSNPMYYQMPGANYAPYTYYSYAAPRVCPHCGAPF